MSSLDIILPDTLYQKFIMPEEMRRLYPSAPAWNGGYRWFQSRNIVDLQNYRSPIKIARIRAPTFPTFDSPPAATSCNRNKIISSV
jgi:hypothetical protein